jgi:hypothetical protein
MSKSSKGRLTILERIAKVRRFPKLRNLKNRLSADGQLDDAIAAAIRRRADEIGMEYFIRATGVTSGSSELDRRIIRDTAKEVGVFGMKGKHPSRTLQMIRDHGLKETVIRCVNRKRPTTAYHCLGAWGEKGLRYEQIVLDFEAAFSEGRTLRNARLRVAAPLHDQL